MKWTPLPIRLSLKTQKLHQWHKWFAWYPVRVADKTAIGEYSTVWLSRVMRSLKSHQDAPIFVMPNVDRFDYATVDTFIADLLTGDRK